MDLNEYGGWIEKDTICEAGDVGGDNQIGEAFNRRFYHPDKPGRLITVSVYAVNYENDAVEGGYELGIEEQIERMICRDIEDPGSTEEDCGYEYNAVDDYATFKSVEEAAIYAKKRLVGMTGDDLSWNGERAS